MSKFKFEYKKNEIEPSQAFYDKYLMKAKIAFPDTYIDFITNEINFDTLVKTIAKKSDLDNPRELELSVQSKFLVTNKYVV